MSDLISRQAAIDALGEAPTYKQRIIKTYAEGRNNQWFDDVTKIWLLPSAQPEQPEIQDILEYLDTVLHPIISPDHWNVYSELHDMISMLSPVEPKCKTGHWKLLKNGDAICSECGFVQVSAWDMDDWDNFCHHCGSYNGG